MNNSTLRSSVSLVVAAILGGFISQAVPLSMQAHAQTNAAPSGATAPTPSASHSYGVIDVTGMKDQDIANSLSNAVSTGWTYRGSVANFIIVSKKGAN